MDSSTIHLRVSRRLLILGSLTWPLGLLFGLGFLSNYTFWATASVSFCWLIFFVRFGLLAWQHVYLSEQDVRVQTYSADYTFAWQKIHAIELVNEPAKPGFMDRDLRYSFATYEVRISDAQQSIIVHTRFTEHDRRLFKTKLTHYSQRFAIPTKMIETLIYPAIYPERLTIWQKIMRLHRPPLTKIPAMLCNLGLLLLIAMLGYLTVSQQHVLLALAAFALYQIFKLSLALLPNAIKQPDALINPQEQHLYVPKLVNKMLFARLCGFYMIILGMILVFI